MGSTKFHPLPGGEGRGEGERKYKTFIGSLTTHNSEPHVGSYK
jgi:hypothetical protein